MNTVISLMAEDKQQPAPQNTTTLPFPILSDDMVPTIQDDREINKSTKNGHENVITVDESAEDNA